LIENDSHQASAESRVHPDGQVVSRKTSVHFRLIVIVVVDFLFVDLGPI
jgi:hypothetical protein